MNSTAIIKLERQRNIYSGISVLTILILLISGFQISENLNSGGFLQGLAKFLDFPKKIIDQTVEEGSIAFLSNAISFFQPLIETINIALFSTIVGGVGAVVLSLGSTRGLDIPEPLIPVFRRTMDLMRSFPELIIALFLIFLLGVGPVPATIAVAFHTAGALGKLFSEVTENIDLRQVEGLKACGASWTDRIRHGVFPQVLPNWTSYFLLRLEINVRASAILGFVGAGGIGTELSRAIGWGRGAEIAALFFLLFLTIFLIDQLSQMLRTKMTFGATRVV